MSGIEAFVAKAVLGPVLSFGVKRATEKLFGANDVKMVAKVCREALDEALVLELRPYEPVADELKGHLLGLLEEGLGIMAEPLELTGYTDSAELGDALVRSTERVDWATFQIVHEGEFVRLDVAAILQRFLAALPGRLRAAAGRHGSPLHNLVTRLESADLRRTLDGIASSLGSLPPAGTTFTWSAAHDRAVARQRAMIDWRLSSDFGRAAYVEATPVSACIRWRGGNDWYARVINESTNADDALGDLGLTDRSLQTFAGELRRARLPYSSVSIRLRDLPLAGIVKRVESRPEATQPDPRTERAVQRALRALRWLCGQQSSPRYEYSMHLSGAFGSGRSRTLTRIAQLVDELGDYVLFLAPTEGETLRQTLLRQSAQLFGRDFRDVQDLAQVLAEETAPHTQLWLLVDDLDQRARRSPDLVPDLQLLLDEATALPVLRWVLAVDADQFDSVLSRDDRYFWVRFGYVPAGQDNTATGWLDVDACNARQRLGLLLLREISERDRADITQIAGDALAFSYENHHLANPLAAWMRHESAARDATSPVTDVNQPGFVREYWDWIKKRITAGDVEEAAVEGTVTEMAREYGHLDLARLPVAANQDRRPFLALRAGGLVSLSWQGNPEVEAQTEYARPVFAAFWGYRIAHTILHNTAHDADTQQLLNVITPWQRRVHSGEGLAEATCQFTLALAGQALSATLWKGWAAKTTAPRVPLIMAATAGPAEQQQTAIDMVTKRQYTPATKRELFVLQRLVHRARLESWQAHDRVAILRNHLEAITDHGLDTYYHQTLQAVLGNPDLVTANNFVNTCQALVGCEQAGAAEVAADLMVLAGRRIYGDDTGIMTRYLLRFCKRVAPGAHSGRKPAKQGKARKPAQKYAEGVTSHDRSTFVEKLTDSFVAHVITTRGAEGCRMLADYGWWTARDQNVSGQLARHLRSTLTTTFGAAMHGQNGNSDFANEYHAVIADILDGRLLQHAQAIDRCEIAFFLIKHSAPTYGRSDVLVDERFRPTLTRLARDRSLSRKLGEQATALYETNNIVSVGTITTGRKLPLAGSAPRRTSP